MDAQRDAAGVDVRGHFARFCLDFVAERRDRLHHAGACAVRAWLAERALQGLLGAFARDGHQAEFVEAQDFRGGTIGAQRVFQRRHHFFAVAALFHVDEVDDDDAAKIAQAHLPHDFLAGFEVGADDRVFQAIRAFADEFAGVDVDRYQRFGVVDYDVAAGFEPDLRAQALVDFLLDAELLEDRRGLGVKLHAIHELRLEAAHEVHDFGVFLFGVHPDRAEIRRDEIAQDAFDQIQVAVQQRRGFALFRARFDFGPGARQEFDVRADFVGSCAARGRAHDEAAAGVAFGFVYQDDEVARVLRRKRFCARRRCGRAWACKPGSVPAVRRGW